MNAARLALLAWLAFAAAATAQTGALARGAPPPDPALAGRVAGADAAAGARTFERRCSTCHDVEKDGKHSKGPLLWNVLGRKAATSAGFAYSDAMRRSGHEWTVATLDYYLADTERAVPGRAMDFTGIPDAKVRADLIAFLRTKGDAPAPLR
ncbi:Cytochrome c2 [Burkholderiales bacterium]|nr:Cytochrome c2 [Burkholderiales bacterium]